MSELMRCHLSSATPIHQIQSLWPLLELAHGSFERVCIHLKNLAIVVNNNVNTNTSLAVKFL